MINYAEKRLKDIIDFFYEFIDAIRSYYHSKLNLNI